MSGRPAASAAQRGLLRVAHEAGDLVSAANEAVENGVADVARGTREEDTHN